MIAVIMPHHVEPHDLDRTAAPTRRRAYDPADIERYRITEFFALNTPADVVSAILCGCPIATRRPRSNRR